MKKDAPESIMRDVIGQLSELRKKNGLSCQLLASRAGISRAAISHLENGRRKPSLMLALKLSAALNVELSDLLKKAEAVFIKLLLYIIIHLTMIKAFYGGEA